MQRKYLYLILFGVPGLVAALIAAFVISAAAAGLSWIFVFGDNPWPAGIQEAVGILFVFVFLVGWLPSLIIGFRMGKRLERSP